MIEGFLQKGEQLFRFGPSYSLKMGLYVNSVCGVTYHARTWNGIGPYSAQPQKVRQVVGAGCRSLKQLGRTSV